MWSQWFSGSNTWPHGAIQTNDVLYYFDGPVIFTARIGLEDYIFYKSAEHEDGDFYLAASVTGDEVSALKQGRLSVRGCLQKPYCWMMDLDFDLNVRRYEKRRMGDVITVLPRHGVAISGAFGRAADSLQQADSPLAFKFYGDELTNGRMPFSTFKSLVDRVHDVVRRTVLPTALRNGRDSQLMDFPIREPAFASLLIAVERPSFDLRRIRQKEHLKSVDVQQLTDESEALSAQLLDLAETTVKKSSTNSLKSYAAENFSFFDNIQDIIPSESADVSKLQISSVSQRGNRFVEIDADVADKIRWAFRSIKNDQVTITGTIVGMVAKSSTFLLRDAARRREITCHLAQHIYLQMLENGDLFVNQIVTVTGELQQRSLRDLMHVTGYPTIVG